MINKKYGEKLGVEVDMHQMIKGHPGIPLKLLQKYFKVISSFVVRSEYHLDTFCQLHLIKPSLCYHQYACHENK